MTDRFSPPPSGCVAALGTFDGVHLGHRAILDRCVREARALSLPPLAWTFSRRPGDFTGEAAGRILSLEEKERLLREAGIEILITREFDRVRALSPEAFCQKILLEECGVRGVVCGFDFRFGKNAEGDAAFLKEYLEPLGVKVVVVDAVRDREGEKISSTAVRLALKNGQMERAGALLGRPYSLALPVLPGKGLGRRLGFPTANLSFPPDHAPLRHGVYAVRALFDGQCRFGVCNLGRRPSFDDGDKVTVETYLFDFNGDLYGKTLRIEFLSFLREETTFDSAQALERQVERDKERAREYFAQ